MKNINTIQTEINDLKKELKLLEERLNNSNDDSAKLFLQNMISYNEEKIALLVEQQNAASK